MGRIERFEDMKAWQKARELTKAVYGITSTGKFGKDYILKDQMRKAAVSTVSNIAEGFERDGRKEFINFLSMAKASAGELRAQLYIAFDLEYISQAEFDRLGSLCQETGRIIGGFLKYLKRSEIKGTKFQDEKTRL